MPYHFLISMLSALFIYKSERERTIEVSGWLLIKNKCCNVSAAAQARGFECHCRGWIIAVVYNLIIRGRTRARKLNKTNYTVLRIKILMPF